MSELDAMGGPGSTLPYSSCLQTPGVNANWATIMVDDASSAVLARGTVCGADGVCEAKWWMLRAALTRGVDGVAATVVWTHASDPSPYPYPNGFDERNQNWALGKLGLGSRARAVILTVDVRGCRIVATDAVCGPVGCPGVPGLRRATLAWAPTAIATDTEGSIFVIGERGSQGTSDCHDYTAGPLAIDSAGPRPSPAPPPPIKVHVLKWTLADATAALVPARASD